MQNQYGASIFREIETDKIAEQIEINAIFMGYMKGALEHGFPVLFIWKILEKNVENS